jgi:hypothetical protein
MSEYAYARCPGGKDKKVKFCCGDLVQELERVDRMLRGQQYVGCLEHVERLDQKHPGRACLVTLKATLERELGLGAQAEQTLATLPQQDENAVVLAEKAHLTLQQQGPQAALEVLQRALAIAPWPLPDRIRPTLALMAEELVDEGRYVSGRLHLLLLLMSDPRDTQAAQAYARLLQAPVGVMNKIELNFEPAPAEAPWKAEHDAAIERATHGAWRAAEQVLAPLAERLADVPGLWTNVALLRLALADESGAAAAWRRLAALNLPLDRKVETEALAQHYDSADGDDLIDILHVDYPLLDADAAMTRLSSSPRVRQLPVDPRLGDEDHPPPRWAYALLSRPIPEADGDLSPEALPVIVGRVLLYGRETDRQARLELFAARGEQQAAAQALLAETVGDALGPASEEHVEDQRLLLSQMLAGDFLLPAGLAPQRADEARRAFRRYLVVERLPSVALKLLGGRTLAAAASDPATQVRVLALILRIELGSPDRDIVAACTELRGRLGLPGPRPAQLDDRGSTGVSILEVRRVEPESLSDEDLLQIFPRAVRAGLADSAARFAQAILDRPSLDDKVEKSQVMLALADLAPSSDEALAWIDRARDAAAARGQSSAPYDLREVDVQISRGDADRVGVLLQHLMDEHGREPGVRQAVAQVMVAIGAIRPDGTPTRPAAEPALAAAAEPGKLWTPDAERPAGQKSSLWLPGME